MGTRAPGAPRGRELLATRPDAYDATMSHRARQALQTLIASTLVLACAGGGETSMTGLSGFVTQGPASDTTPTSMGTTTEAAPTTSGDTMRMTTTEDMRETTTESPDETTTGPVTATDVSTTSTTGPDSSSGGDESTGPVILCGNAMIDAPEECDGQNLNGADCKSLGFTGGTLVCTSQCIFDKAMCTSPSCGDMTVDPGEECDCGNQGAMCTAAQLGNAACTSLVSPNGGNYTAGTLACNSPNSCSFNKNACTYCGDAIKNGPEPCDGADLGGQTCNSQGFVGGSLSCTPACAFNTGGCTNCGNNQVDGNEQCDGGNFNGKTCASQDPGKFAGGNLTCSGSCDSISTGGCNSGNCCNTGGAGACSVVAIKNCVCGLDPFCCSNSWDSICVGEAKTDCGAQCP